MYVTPLILDTVYMTIKLAIIIVEANSTFYMYV